MKAITLKIAENFVVVLEMRLHEQFQRLRLNGEWFKADTTLLAYVDSL